MKVKFGFYETGGTGKYGGKIGEATVVKFHKNNGDRVEKGEKITDVDTDKTSLEITAPISGIITSIDYQEGELWKEGDIEETLYGIFHNPPLGYIETESGVVPEITAPEKEKTDKAATLVLPADTAPIRAVPAARELARALKIDLRDVKGTGESGVIKLQDVQNFAALHSEKDRQKEKSEQPAAEKNTADRIIVPATTIRKTVARYLTLSHQKIVRVGDAITIEVHTLVKFINAHKNMWQKLTGTKLRYDYFFMFFAAKHLLLEEFRILNAYWDEETESVVYLKNANVGMAMDTERGLMVPVVHGAENLSFVELAKAAEDKIRRAHSSELSLNDLRGLTFTINNVGVAGGEDPDPAVPYTSDLDGNERPTGMILAIAKIDTRFAEPEVKVVCRFDHRLVDGGPVMRFMKKLKEWFEEKEEPEDWEKIL